MGKQKTYDLIDLGTHMEGPNCHQCKHFFITFDVAVPYGCRAFRFKSKEIPSRAVKQNSGNECQVFAEKEHRKIPVKENPDLKT
ncbi:MAG: uracil-DNA glycosylase [Bdellovibrionota bacterium]